MTRAAPAEAAATTASAAIRVKRSVVLVTCLLAAPLVAGCLDVWATPACGPPWDAAVAVEGELPQEELAALLGALGWRVALSGGLVTGHHEERTNLTLRAGVERDARVPSVEVAVENGAREPRANFTEAVDPIARTLEGRLGAPADVAYNTPCGVI